MQLTPEERAANEESSAAADPDAVADAHPARAAADRARRDRERAVLLPLHLPATSCRGCTARSRTCCAPQVPRRRDHRSRTGAAAWAAWIGGDRDGNPYVTPDVTRHALVRQSSTALDYYPRARCTRLGSELSQSLRLVAVTPELEELAARSPDHSEHRRDEPYRRALTGIYARLAATSRTLDQHAPVLAEIAPSQTLRGRGRVRARPRASSPIRSTRNGAGRLARRPAARADARRAGVRLPPRAARPAPAQRRARAGRGGAVRGRRAPRRLSRAWRRGAAALAARRAERPAAAALAASRPTASSRQASCRFWIPPPSCSGAMVRARCPTTSSPTPTA